MLTRVFAETKSYFDSLRRTRTLAELIRTISKAPIPPTTYTWHVITRTDCVLFHFNREQKRFVPRLKLLDVDVKELLRFCEVGSGAPLPQLKASCERQGLLLTLGDNVTFDTESNFMLAMF